MAKETGLDLVNGKMAAENLLCVLEKYIKNPVHNN